MATFASIWQALQQASAPVPYLLIDCAGIDGGEARLPREAFAELECLFTGDLAVELANVGPYLARLKSYAPNVRNVVQDLLERQVATLVVLRQPESGQDDPTFAQLHRHFRKFNVVYDPGGRPLFFRYYDPRVVIGVLDVLDAAQLDAFFGRVDSLIVSGADGQAIRCQRRAGTVALTR